MFADQHPSLLLEPWKNMNLENTHVLATYLDDALRRHDQEDRLKLLLSDFSCLIRVYRCGILSQVLILHIFILFYNMIE